LPEQTTALVGIDRDSGYMRNRFVLASEAAELTTNGCERKNKWKN
jgi:hypothetical protein